MRTLCKHCKRPFRWTRKRCPRCQQPNENRPALVAAKLGVLMVGCVAIWITIRSFMAASDRATGVIEQVAGSPDK